MSLTFICVRVFSSNFKILGGPEKGRVKEFQVLEISAFENFGSRVGHIRGSNSKEQVKPVHQTNGNTSSAFRLQRYERSHS